MNKRLHTLLIADDWLDTVNDHKVNMENAFRTRKLKLFELDILMMEIFECSANIFMWLSLHSDFHDVQLMTKITYSFDPIG